MSHLLHSFAHLPHSCPESGKLKKKLKLLVIQQHIVHAEFDKNQENKHNYSMVISQPYRFTY
jgi:hypothetical protein